MTTRNAKNTDLEVPRNKLFLNRSTSIEHVVPTNKKKMTIKISPPSLVNFSDKVDSPINLTICETESENIRKNE